jgi:hypothetical protein
MINLTKFILTSLLLGFAYGDLGPMLVPGDYGVCPQDFATTCNLQCPNGNYLLDDKGCPTCACAAICPEIKCRANCGDAGYQLDENGCQTCKCVSKEKVQCSRFMCRMYCQNGFKRDENGCEYCACNESPQECPQLTCENLCSNGYRKDYSGCDTCECLDEQIKTDDKCLPLTCDLTCKYDLQRDEFGCKLCSCNPCPVSRCRMYCMYGFRKNEDGCEICECDWTPVADKIQCDERIPCPDTRICNLNLKLCEAVDPDRVNWFVYDFEIESELFKDDRFIQAFKSGLIYNIAAKYGLERTQISVSSVEDHGLTSFQIMPFFNENMEIFDQKMEQIDIDLNSHEFRTVLPGVASAIEDGNFQSPSRTRTGVNRWCQRLRNQIRTSPIFYTIICLLFSIGCIFLVAMICQIRRRLRRTSRSESKTAIYDDASYQLAPSDDDYKAVCAPDGTKYVVITSDDTHGSNDKQAMV